MASTTGPWVVRLWVEKSHYAPITLHIDFPHVELETALHGIPRKWNRVDIDTPTRTSGRRAIPPVKGG